MTLRTWPPLLLLLASGSALACPAAPPADPPIAALKEGNRLHRQGDLTRAMEVYEAAYDPRAPDPLLAYNLGTTAHQLDRLPEAVLWYRRAATALGSDPWVEGNLSLARRALGAPVLPPPRLFAWWRARRDLLRGAGIVLAWAALLTLALRPRGRRVWPVALAVAALAAYAAGALPRWLGPRPAVLLAACPGPDRPLPAGTEVWLRGRPGAWTIAGAPGVACPEGAIALVEGGD